MENSDDEYETEEAIVLVELNGIIDPDFLLKEQTPTKLLGVETEEPVLQIGHYIFSGGYEDTLGTVVAYETVKTTDSEGKETEEYKFLCKTDKQLSMKRIFLQEKENEETDNVHSPQSELSEAMDCSDAATDHNKETTKTLNT